MAGFRFKVFFIRRRDNTILLEKVFMELNTFFLNKEIGLVLLNVLKNFDLDPNEILIKYALLNIGSNESINPQDAKEFIWKGDIKEVEKSVLFEERRKKKKRRDTILLWSISWSVYILIAILIRNCHIK